MQSRIVTELRRTWIPSSVGADTATRSRTTPSRVSTAIPYSPPTTVTSRTVHVAGADAMPPRTTAPGLPDRASASSVEHERPLVDAGREVDGRRLGRPGRPEHEQERAPAPARPSAAPGPAELAAVLGVGEPQRAASRRGRAPARAATSRRRTHSAGSSGAATSSSRRERHRRAELEQPERHRDPARLVAEAGGGRARRRARRRRRSSARRARAATRRRARARARQAARNGTSAAASRDSSRPLSVYDMPHPAQEAPCGVLHPDEGVGGRIGPLRRRRPRARACAPSSVRPRHRRVGVEHEPAAVASRARAPRRAGEQRIVPEAAPEAGRADRPGRPPSTRGGDPEAALARRALERLVPVAPGRVRGRGAAPRAIAARSAGERRVEARPGRASRTAAAGVERPAKRLAPANRDDARARRERVQPLRRRGHPGADDRDASRVPVRLVGVHDARVARELGREARGPGGRGRAGRARNGARRAVELEAAVDGADPLDAPPADARRPSRFASRSSSTWRRNSATVGRYRLHTVWTSGAASPRRIASRGARPGNERREQCPSLSERIAPLADRLGARPPGADGSGLGVEDGDLGRLEAAVAERLVRDEAGESAADDRDVAARALT